MLKRYGIVAPKAYGVPMGAIQRLAKSLGRDHDLALALWSSGWYEARLLAAYVDQPERVSSAQMDRWAKDFDNWGVCDTLCFCLFDRTPHAWRKVDQWAGRRDEFVRRAAFALLASLALHDKQTDDAPFLATLPLIERAAADERNFVKKGVSWALRSVGRRSAALRAASVELARRLAASKQPAERWVGKDALRDLAKGGGGKAVGR
jgi:3-methyladenine DNA glycosylase AlkD